MRPLEKNSIPLILKNDIQKISQRNKIRICFHPQSPKECCGKKKGAHSVSKSPFLNAITENGKKNVIEFNIRISDGEDTCKEKSIKSVSKFYGFCEKHDTEFFRNIEARDFEANKQNAFLLNYRSTALVAYRYKENQEHNQYIIDRIDKIIEYNKTEFKFSDAELIVEDKNGLICEEIREEIKSILNKINPNNTDSRNSEKFLENIKEIYTSYLLNIKKRYTSRQETNTNYLTNTENLLNLQKQMFNTKKYDSFRYIYIFYNEKIPFAGSSSVGVYDKNGKLVIVTIHILPINQNNESKNYILLTWLSDEESIPINAIKECAEQEKNNLLNLCLTLSFTNQQNIFCTKETWDNLHCETRRKIETVSRENSNKQESSITDDCFDFSLNFSPIDSDGNVPFKLAL
ncbi:MAG: hypothetical protein ABF697_08725 [Zymomonas mobilis]|uniref:hypothetical protein n=1 Tax=Zymomonas mobilis TaxID=542 RepID=UPI0039EC1AD2